MFDKGRQDESLPEAYSRLEAQERDRRAAAQEIADEDDRDHAHRSRPRRYHPLGAEAARAAVAAGLRLDARERDRRAAAQEIEDDEAQGRADNDPIEAEPTEPGATSHQAEGAAEVVPQMRGRSLHNSIPNESAMFRTKETAIWHRQSGTPCEMPECLGGRPHYSESDWFDVWVANPDKWWAAQADVIAHRTEWSAQIPPAWCDDEWDPPRGPPRCTEEEWRSDLP